MKEPSPRTVAGALVVALRDCQKYSKRACHDMLDWNGSVKAMLARGDESFVSLDYDGNKLWIGYHNEKDYSPYWIKSFKCKDVEKAMNKAISYVLWEERY